MSSGKSWTHQVLSCTIYIYIYMHSFLVFLPFHKKAKKGDIKKTLTTLIAYRNLKGLNESSSF